MKIILPTVTLCSYCTRPATRIGKGQDGDSYCPTHEHLAPAGTDPR